MGVINRMHFVHTRPTGRRLKVERISESVCVCVYVYVCVCVCVRERERERGGEDKTDVLYHVHTYPYDPNKRNTFVPSATSAVTC